MSVNPFAPRRNAFDASAAPPALPDLQALVAEHGSYDKITPAAWLEYDAAIARHRAAVIKQIRDDQAQNLNQFRPPVRKTAGKARDGPAGKIR